MAAENSFSVIQTKTGSTLEPRDFSHERFRDFTMFNRDNYFSTELLDDEWNTPSGKIAIQFYRRPLSAIFTYLLEAGFTIEKVVEPMPTEAFKQKLPQAYERLTKRPQFLFIRVRKLK